MGPRRMCAPPVEEDEELPPRTRPVQREALSDRQALGEELPAPAPRAATVHREDDGHVLGTS